MTATPEELARYYMAALDNPRQPRENALTYIHRLAVIAGGIKDDDAPRTMPKANRALPPEQREVRLPYRDAPEDEYADQEVPF